MVNLLDLKWLLRCQQQLKDMADDPDYAAMIVRELDKDADLRLELASIYARALRTLKASGGR